MIYYCWQGGDTVIAASHLIATGKSASVVETEVFRVLTMRASNYIVI